MSGQSERMMAVLEVLETKHGLSAEFDYRLVTSDGSPDAIRFESVHRATKRRAWAQQHPAAPASTFPGVCVQTAALSVFEAMYFENLAPWPWEDSGPYPGTALAALDFGPFQPDPNAPPCPTINCNCQLPPVDSNIFTPANPENIFGTIEVHFGPGSLEDGYYEMLDDDDDDDDDEEDDDDEPW